MANQVDSENVGSIDMEVDAIRSYSERVDSLIRSETASFYGDSPLYTFASLVDTAIRSSFDSSEADYEAHSSTTINVHSQELSLQQSHNKPYSQILTQQTHFHHLPHHSNEASSGVIRAQRMRWTAALHSRFVQLLSGHPSKEMGVGGTLEYLSDLVGSGYNHKKKKKQFQTVELKMRMDCDGCELKVMKALSSLSGVKSVEINRKQQKVTVIGYVEPNKVLNKAKSTGKKAEIWPFVPYNLVAHPYAVQA
ncbi:hypothetical protein Fmac_014625 [Flemingia macrophylla]|uniref:HMA domain-containing protein n=1 Tax=Flemingia macrophylla TaxID=520843 RepID=A0ABD1MCD7_9FABA